MSLAITIGIILSEFLIVGMIVFFIMRRRCRIKASPGTAVQAQSPKRELQDLLEFEIARMRQVIDVMSDGLSSADQQALARRLALLEAEKSMHVELAGEDLLDNYQQVIVRYYRPDEDKSPEFDKLQAAVSGYQRRVENLECFRELFFKSQDKLSESFGIIRDLQGRLAQGQGDDEEATTLVEALEKEKRKLQSELDIADHEFEAIMENISSVPGTDANPSLLNLAELEETVDKLRGIEEENQFLQEQIQYLLKQELQRSHQFEADIEQLKQQLEHKDASHAALEKKYLEMESRYLELASA